MKKVYIFLLTILLGLVLSCEKTGKPTDVDPPQEIRKKTNRLVIRGTEEPVSVNPNLSQALKYNSLISFTGLLDLIIYHSTLL